MFSRFKKDKKKGSKKDETFTQPMPSDPQYMRAATIFDKSLHLNGGVYTGSNSNNSAFTTDNLPPNPYHVATQVKTARGPQSEILRKSHFNCNNNNNNETYGVASSLFDNNRDAKTEISYHPSSARQHGSARDDDFEVQSDIGGFARRSGQQNPHARRSERRPREHRSDRHQNDVFQVPRSARHHQQTIIESPPSRCAVSSSQSDNDGAAWRPDKMPKMGGYAESRKAKNIQLKQYERSPSKQPQQPSAHSAKRSIPLSSHSNTMSNSSSPLPDMNEKLMKMQRRDERLWNMVCDMLKQLHGLTSSDSRSSSHLPDPPISRSNIKDLFRHDLDVLQEHLNDSHNWLQLRQQYDKKLAEDAQKIEQLKQRTEKLEQQRRSAVESNNELHMKIVQLEAQNSYLTKERQSSQNAAKHDLTHHHGVSIMSFADHQEYPLGDSPVSNHVNEGLISRPTSFMCPPPDSSMSTTTSSSHFMPPPMMTPRRSKQHQRQHSNKPTKQHRDSVRSTAVSSVYASVPSTSYATPLGSHQGTLNRATLPQAQTQPQYTAFDMNHDADEDEDDEITVNFGNRDVDSGTSTAGTADTHSSQSAGQKPPKIFAGEAPLYKENYAPGMSIGDLDLSDIEKARGGALLSGSSILSAAFPPPSIISDSGNLPCRSKSSRSSNKSSTPKQSPTKSTNSQALHTNIEPMIVGFARMAQPNLHLPHSIHRGTAIRDALLLVSGHSSKVHHNQNYRHQIMSPTASQIDDDGYATLTNDRALSSQASANQHSTAIVALHLLQSIMKSSSMDMAAAKRLIHLDRAGSVSTDSLQWDTLAQQAQDKDVRSMSTSCISSQGQDNDLQYWHMNREIVAPLAECPVDGRTINAHLMLTAGLRRTLSDSVLTGSHAFAPRSRLSRLLYLLVCARARYHWPAGNKNQRLNRSLSACDLTEHGRDQLRFDEPTIVESSTSDRLHHPQHNSNGTSASNSDIEAGTSRGVSREALYDGLGWHGPKEQSTSPDTSLGDQTSSLHASSDTEGSCSGGDRLQPLPQTRTLRCTTPHRPVPNRSRKANSSYTSEDSDDDGRTTVQEWVRQLKKKPSFDERRAVVKYSPPRASILTRDVFRHFGEGERKALEHFAFLKGYATDVSSSGGLTSPECGVPASSSRRNRIRRSCSDLALNQSVKEQTVMEERFDKVYENLPLRPQQQQKQQKSRPTIAPKPRIHHTQQSVAQMDKRGSTRSHDSSILLGDLVNDAADQSFSSGSSLSFQSN